MMKRSFPFDEDLSYGRQFKLHRSCCRTEANLPHYKYDQLFIPGASVSFSEHNHVSNNHISRTVTINRPMDVTVVTQPPVKNFKQMLLNRYGQLCEMDERDTTQVSGSHTSATTALTANCPSCYKHQLAMRKQCDFCEKFTCDNCIRQCIHCNGEYCSLCSFPSYCSKLDTAICLSCS